MAFERLTSELQAILRREATWRKPGSNLLDCAIEACAALDRIDA